MKRSRLFHAVVMVGTSLTASGPPVAVVAAAAAMGGCGESSFPIVDAAPARDLACEQCWPHVDGSIPQFDFSPPVDMAIDQSWAVVDAAPRFDLSSPGDMGAQSDSSSSDMPGDGGSEG